MNRLGRSLLVGTIALTIAACAGPGESLAPRDSPEPTASAEPIPPSAVPSLLPPSVPTPQPSVVRTFANSCRYLNNDYEVPPIEIYPRTGHLGGEFGVQDVVPHEYPDVVIPGPPFEPDVYAAELPGGWDMPLDLWVNYSDREHMAPIELLSFSTVVRVDGFAPQVLESHATPRNVILWDVVVHDIPDVDARARLDFRVTWKDRCFSYMANATIDGIQIVSTTTTAGCSMVEETYSEDLTSLFEPPLRVGPGEADIFPSTSEARYMPVGNAGIDFFAAYAWDADAPPIPAVADGFLEVAATQTGLDLLTMESVVWTRRSVVDAIKDYPPYGLDEVLHRTPARQPDGSFRMRVPTEPGRYVGALGFAFESSCSTGEAWAVFSLTVTEHAPGTPSPTPTVP